MSPIRPRFIFRISPRKNAPDETIETIRTLLESALEHVDGDETNYKLRTALQLLEFQESQIERIQTAAENDRELRERLDTLGYLE